MDEQWEPIAANVGTLLRLQGLLTLTPAAVALLFLEFYAIPGFALAALLAYASGATLERRYERGGGEEVHGLITAAVAWFVAGAYASLPFLFVAWTVAADPSLIAPPPETPTVRAFLSPVNALFEGMSGVIGTGLTMTRNESVLPAAIQWWRSLLQWVGAIGVVVLAAAVALTGESESFRELYESRGAVASIRDDTRETITLIWWIFALLTFVAILALWLAGMPLWHAINHGMTGIGTGGFVVTDDGIAGYDAASIELVLLPIMVLGAISFAVHHYLLRGDVETLYGDAQTRWLIALLGIGSLLVVAALASRGRTAFPGRSATAYSSSRRRSPVPASRPIQPSATAGRSRANSPSHPRWWSAAPPDRPPAGSNSSD